MQVLRTIVRVLIGLLFILAGVMTFFIAPPPQPGLAGAVSEALYHSHWSYFVAAAQLVLGVLLVTNRYVPLALTLLFAFLYNSFAYHLGTSAFLLPIPIVIAALAVFIGWPYRAAFAALFQATPERGVADMRRAEH
ncbi:MAG TPA: DoxX family membrane protein [Candidatus Baltobacteraceae bacterium]|nr:DoxX family membrane protein [Candidatus Baltobacteraceae bacterium]